MTIIIVIVVVIVILGWFGAKTKEDDSDVIIQDSKDTQTEAKTNTSAIDRDAFVKKVENNPDYAIPTMGLWFYELHKETTGIDVLYDEKKGVRTVSARMLIESLLDNFLRFKNDYDKKIIVIKDILGSLSFENGSTVLEVGDATYTYVGNQKGKVSAKCYMEKNDEIVYSQLSTGNTIYIIGVIDEKIFENYSQSTKVYGDVETKIALNRCYIFGYNNRTIPFAVDIAVNEFDKHNA